MKKLHVVFIKKDGYTEFRTSDNHTGSEPCGVGETIIKLVKLYKHFTLEVI
jgi:hypothetical protein